MPNQTILQRCLTQVCCVLVLFVVSKAFTDEAELLAAIRVHPDEDTPRLAYADWLIEHGTADQRKLAEFIQAQIALSRMDPTDRHYKAKTKEVDYLLSRNYRKWVAQPLQVLDHRADTGIFRYTSTHDMSQRRTTLRWRRGFIEGIEVPGEWLRAGEFRDALDGLPGLRSLSIWGSTGRNSGVNTENVGGWIAWKGFGRLTEVDIVAMLDDGQWAMVSRALGKVHALRLNGYALTSAAVRILRSSGYVKSLRSLAFQWMDRSLLTPLLRARELDALESLSLSPLHPDLTREELSDVANLKYLPALRRLGIYTTHASLLDVIEGNRFPTLSQFAFFAETMWEIDDTLSAIARRGRNLLHLDVAMLEDDAENHEGVQSLLAANRARAGGCPALLEAFQEF